MPEAPERRMFSERQRRSYASRPVVFMNGPLESQKLPVRSVCDKKVIVASPY